MQIGNGYNHDKSIVLLNIFKDRSIVIILKIKNLISFSHFGHYDQFFKFQIHKTDQKINMCLYSRKQGSDC